MSLSTFSRGLLAAVSLAAMSGAAFAADETSNTVQSVVITAPRREVLARTEQKNAVEIVNIQSAETIAKYPDYNAAEALGRIPGVSLSSDTGEGRFVNIRGIDANLNGATMGGVVLLNTYPGGVAAGGGGRAVEFDTVPQGVIDGIIVYKTGAADREAEGLGGSIEITPRSAANIHAPFVESALGWGDEPLHDHTGPFNLELAAGARFGFDSTGLVVDNAGKALSPRVGWISNPTPFSFVLTASRRDDRRAIDDLEEGYIDDSGVARNAAAGIQGKAVSEYDFRRYDYHRRRFGYGGEFDFQPNDNHSYYARLTVGGYIEAVHKNFLLLKKMDGAENSDGSVPTLADGTTFAVTALPQITLTDEQETHRNTVFAVGGKDQFDSLAVDYHAAYSRATFSKGYNFGAKFYGPKNTPVDYNNILNAKYPTFSYPNGFDPNNASNYKLNSLSNSSEFDVDEEYTYAANAELPLHLLQSDDRLKFGAEARLRTKTVATYSLTGLTVPSLSLAAASSAANTYYDGRYTNGPYIDRYVIRGLINGQAGAVNSPDPTFTADENITAGYGQYSTTFNKLNLVAGVRVEATDDNFGGAKNSYTDVFPNLTATYKVSPEFQIRGVYWTGISRPGFNQVNPAHSLDDPSNPTTDTVGNPNLKPITGNNFDVSLEYYLPAGGILQFGLFDKEFDHYIVPRLQHGVTNDPAAPGSTVTLVTYINANSGYARGLEIAWHQQFLFLPKPFQGFGVEANYTAVDSRFQEYDAGTSFTGVAQYGPLPGTSHITWNLAGFYEAYGVQARLSTEYVSHSLFGLSGNGNSSGGDRSLDTIQDKRLTMDFTSSYTFRPGWAVHFNAKNLLNTPLRYYEGSTNRPIQREFYDETYEAGVRAKF